MENHYKHLDLSYLKKEAKGNKVIEKNMLEILILQLKKFNKSFITLSNDRKWYLLGYDAFFAKETIRIYGLHDMANDLNKLEHMCRKISKTEGINLSSSVAIPITFDNQEHLPPASKEIIDIVAKFSQVATETIEEVNHVLKEYQ